MTTHLRQMPAVQRRRTGDFVVTAINDGFIELPPEVILGVSPTDVDALYRRAGRRPPYRTAINCFLLDGPDGTILVDTGAGDLMGEHLGRTAGHLSAAGMQPQEVATVFLTHLHTDHVGGTLTRDGDAAFPSANIVIAREELDYWSDRGNVDSSPEATRDAFDVVERMMSAYRRRLVALDGPTELLPGVRTLPLPGHTPGHTGLELAGADMIICGDIFHAAELQLTRPDIGMVFDVNAARAAATRRALLDRASAEDVVLAGTHIVFPGFLRVARRGDDFLGFAEPWQYDLRP